MKGNFDGKDSKPPANIIDKYFLYVIIPIAIPPRSTEETMPFLIGGQTYPEGKYPPECGGSHNWHVWCVTGALNVLESDDHAAWLHGNNDGVFTINFDNGAAARIRPTDPLWRKLSEVAERFSVEVFPLPLGTGYIPWAGKETDLREFDAIRITKKPS